MIQDVLTSVHMNEFYLYHLEIYFEYMFLDSDDSDDSDDFLFVVIWCFQTLVTGTESGPCIVGILSRGCREVRNFSQPAEQMSRHQQSILRQAPIPLDP